MAKLLERIINRRLITELESSGLLDKRQHVFRAESGTDTYFAELERSLLCRRALSRSILRSVEGI